MSIVFGGIGPGNKNKTKIIKFEQNIKMVWKKFASYSTDFGKANERKNSLFNFT